MQSQVSYQEAITRKYPEAIALAIMKDPQGKYNPISLGWVMNTSHEPPMFAISIGKTRYSYEAMEKAEEFVISFPSTEMAEAVLLFGTKSGADMDKLAASGLKTQPAEKIEGVLLSEAVANFECILDGRLDSGDHDIFAGRVVASHIHEDTSVKRLYTLSAELKMGGVKPE